ncbi:MAG: Eco57I restriction-modification methylase domain-containing protein [Gammaproteobacteria bacterium]
MTILDTAEMKAISTALSARGLPLADDARAFFAALGYESGKTMPGSFSAMGFFDALKLLPQFKDGINETDFRNHVKEAAVVCQFGDDEINAANKGGALFPGKFRRTDIQSFVFIAIDLKPNGGYGRGLLARMTRAINRRLAMPAVVFFRHNDDKGGKGDDAITLSFVHRRAYKKDKNRDTIGRVSMLRAISRNNPHRGHLDILTDLTTKQRMEWIAKNNKTPNFDNLLAAWLDALDTEALNLRFYAKLLEWFNRAVGICTFPDGKDKKEEQVMRMITRLLFVWFVKEKSLAPPDLFDEAFARRMLCDYKRESSDYYRAVLQNLFFATLNTPPEQRRFRMRIAEGKNKGEGAPEEHRDANLYRYEDLLRDKDAFIAAVKEVPFVNGGLFDCLDPFESGGYIPDRKRVDCFTDNKTHRKLMSVPARLFFDDDGLFSLFDKFKFTVSENTPIEEEVALDPELLGLVFENLLAAITPETRDNVRKETALRKQTGSFYTPRRIVDYMTDEALVSYFCGRIKKQNTTFQNRLRDLVHWDGDAAFSDGEKDDIIKAINEMKMLDPAVGSGAYPMGMLHKLVHILYKTDRNNEKWKQAQLKAAGEIPDLASREESQKSIRHIFSEKNNYGDYARKLYLIQRVIHGADIQPVAVQIARLRFFISLLIDQKPRKGSYNQGIAPLPNLETNFVAADTLTALKYKNIQKGEQGKLEDPRIKNLMADINRMRERHFIAKTRKDKYDIREQDETLRRKLAKALIVGVFDKEDAERVAKWDLYDQTAKADWFDPELMLGVRNGFGIVIGNPPYVRADSGERHLAYRQRLMASGQYETLYQKWDLYIPFMERGFQLLAPGGIESLIISDAYCRAKYGKKSRQWFLQNSVISRLDFYTPIKLFKAGVHNLSFVFRKAEGGDNIPLRRLHNEAFGNVEVLSNDKQSEEDEGIFAYDKRGGGGGFSVPIVPLRDICHIRVGVVAHSASESGEHFGVFDLLSEVKSKTHPASFVLGKDIGRFFCHKIRYMEWGTKRAPGAFFRKAFPELFNAAEKIIALRSPGRRSVKLFYDDAQIHFDASAVGFVLWRELAGVENRSIVKDARYRHQKPRQGEKTREALEQISNRFSLLYLYGIMASDTARQYLDANRRSNMHLYPDDWKALRIPDISPEEQKPIIQLVRQIMATKAQNPAADTTAKEQQLNQKTATLYGIPKAK